MDDKITRLQKLWRFARELLTYWDRFTARCQQPQCDKYGAQFVRGKRDAFRVFSATVSFEAHSGNYGNSGCQTFGSFDSDLAEEYFVRALNHHKRELFETMGRLASQDSKKMSAEVQNEIHEWQALVNEARAQGEMPGLNESWKAENESETANA